MSAPSSVAVFSFSGIHIQDDNPGSAAGLDALKEKQADRPGADDQHLAPEADLGHVHAVGDTGHGLDKGALLKAHALSR